MTWRSAICFSALIAICVAILPARTDVGVVQGQVLLVGSKDAAVKKKNDFSGVVVWLTAPENPNPPLVHKHVQMIQKDKRFTPHILVIETGTSVDFPNLDPIFHNAFSNFDGQIFDIGLYPPGSSRSIRLTKPGIVKVFCNIHPSMSATIVVVNSAYFTITDNDGDYSIPDVSPGTYQVHFFHERATPETLAKLAQTIVVNREGYELASTAISEAGYLAAGHKNKYGRDYPPESDNADGYSVSIR